MKLASFALAAVLALGATKSARADLYKKINASSTSWNSHTATPLADGRVLVAGGITAPSSAEIYDPKADAWTTLKPLPKGRQHAGAARLPDGRVLVVGGTIDGTVSSSTELYDPTKDTWSPGPETNAPHLGPVITLSDGAPAAFLGMGLESSLETLQLGTMTWTARAKLAPEFARAWLAPLADGGVLACSTATSACMRWEPAEDKWIATAPMPARGDYVVLHSLSDGRVLLAGVKSPSIYVPLADTWTALPAAIDHGGPVLVVSLPGAVAILGQPNGTSKAETEVLNLATGKITRLPGLNYSLFDATVTPLLDGRALILLGGGSGILFTPPRSCEKDAECASGFCTDGVCCDQRCDGQCEACDAGDRLGTCSPIDGVPHGTRALCAPEWTPACKAKTCVGALDRTACRAPAIKVPCDCTRDDECESGHCSDGVCCDKACTGQCQACDVPGARGVCIPVLGEPRGNRRGCPAAGRSICSVYACNGKVEDHCLLANGSQTMCGILCGSVQQHCDGQGGCGLPSELKCPDATCAAGPIDSTAPPRWFDAIFVVAAAALWKRLRR